MFRRLLRFYPALPAHDRFTELRPEQLLRTIGRLAERIRERFPESGLLQVCEEFYRLAEQADDVAVRLQRPLWPVRIAAVAAAALLLFVAVGAVLVLAREFRLQTSEIADLLQATEAAINELIFLGLALYFLVNLETRLKRQAALEALHRLRSVAHVVDMHQLTKDPASLLLPFNATPASPARTLGRYELTRYLDYCSELLALTSKVAALFGQNMDDPVVLNAVNDLESLTHGLSGKIWQKIMILDLAVDGQNGTEA
jgi:hypothetical protein